MKKERLARGWSLLEFSAHTGINIGHVSRIENGRSPPTEKVATACDAAFPGRKGWFTEYYEELRRWSEVPASFKSWPEYEDKAASLRDWSPSIMTGLLQTEDYARALLTTLPGATPTPSPRVSQAAWNVSARALARRAAFGVVRR